LVLLLSGACGESDPTPSGAAPTTTGEAPAGSATTSARTVVPDVVVRDVGTGSDVNVRALGLAERPTLYWFWAPH
jgi:hypothetical protein